MFESLPHIFVQPNIFTLKVHFFVFFGCRNAVKTSESAFQFSGTVMGKWTVPRDLMS